MNTHNIKTSHELADMLEGVARASREFADTLEGVANVLREPPELQLTGPGQTLDAPDVPKNVQQKDNKQSAQFRWPILPIGSLPSKRLMPRRN